METQETLNTAIMEEAAKPVIPTDSLDRLDGQMRVLVRTWNEYIKDGGRMSAAAESLEQQVIDLYKEREEAGGLSYQELNMTLEGLNAQLHSLYEDREGSTEACQVLQETVNNFEAQLASLYEERDHAASASPIGDEIDRGAAERRAEEHSTLRYGVTEANTMVDSLEEQVAALLEERDDLSVQLAQTSEAAAEQVIKARSLITAVFDRALKA